MSIDFSKGNLIVGAAPPDDGVSFSKGNLLMMTAPDIYVVAKMNLIMTTGPDIFSVSKMNMIVVMGPGGDPESPSVYNRRRMSLM